MWSMKMEYLRFYWRKSVIIDCTPLVQNLDRRGSKYFNTERNALVTKEEDLPEIIIEIKLKEPKNVPPYKLEL